MPRWNTKRSTQASIIATGGAIVVAITTACLLPFVPRVNQDGPVRVDPDWFTRALPAMYLCLAAGLAALVTLLVVLVAILHDEVFTTANVARLRAISWCGVAIALVCVVAGFATGAVIAWLVIALIAGFMALIMRIVKNVIDTARVLQEDADYTI
ncbi:MAG: DUF2975 domain-containing protein [Actinomycetia bacterium]|nr:DUF2975 domain-containing protein [Actinomycetes bacterium]